MRLWKEGVKSFLRGQNSERMADEFDRSLEVANQSQDSVSFPLNDGVVLNNHCRRVATFNLRKTFISGFTKSRRLTSFRTPHFAKLRGNDKETDF